MAVEGWYPDDEDSSLVRWWNGEEWTDHTRLYSEVVEQASAPTAATAAAATTAETVVSETSAEPRRPKLPRRSRDTAAVTATASAGAAAAAKWTAKTDLSGGENFTIKPATDRRVPIAIAAALLLVVGIVIAFVATGGDDDGGKVRVEGVSVKRTTTTAPTTTEASVAIIDAATTIAEPPTLPPATAAPDLAPTIPPSRSATPTTARARTTKPARAKAPATTTTQPPAVRFVKGAVETLDQVWFADRSGPAAGSACTPPNNITTVVKITDPTGAVVGTAAFGAGTIRYAVKSNAAERAQRTDLIRSIYDAKIVTAEATGDSVLVAELKLKQAQAILAEAEHPENSAQPFEGNAFQAAYCHMDFASGPVPDRSAYTLTAGGAAGTTLSRETLAAQNWTVQLDV